MILPQYNIVTTVRDLIDVKHFSTVVKNYSGCNFNFFLYFIVLTLFISMLSYFRCLLAVEQVAQYCILNAKQICLKFDLILLMEFYIGIHTQIYYKT